MGCISTGESPRFVLGQAAVGMFREMPRDGDDVVIFQRHMMWNQWNYTSNPFPLQVTVKIRTYWTCEHVGWKMRRLKRTFSRCHTCDNNYPTNEEEREESNIERERESGWTGLVLPNLQDRKEKRRAKANWKEKRRSGTRTWEETEKQTESILRQKLGTFCRLQWPLPFQNSWISQEKNIDDWTCHWCKLRCLAFDLPSPTTPPTLGSWRDWNDRGSPRKSPGALGLSLYISGSKKSYDQWKIQDPKMQLLDLFSGHVLWRYHRPEI